MFPMPIAPLAMPLDGTAIGRPPRIIPRPPPVFTQGTPPASATCCCAGCFTAGASCPGASGPGVGGESDKITSVFVNRKLGGGAGLNPPINNPFKRRGEKKHT
jgi:hypothetical protein